MQELVETSFTEGMLTTVEKPARAGANTIAETPGSLETPVAESTSTHHLYLLDKQRWRFGGV
jgi:hypothetical protein